MLYLMRLLSPLALRAKVVAHLRVDPPLGLVAVVLGSHAAPVVDVDRDPHESSLA